MNGMEIDKDDLSILKRYLANFPIEQKRLKDLLPQLAFNCLPCERTTTTAHVTASVPAPASGAGVGGRQGCRLGHSTGCRRYRSYFDMGKFPIFRGHDPAFSPVVWQWIRPVIRPCVARICGFYPGGRPGAGRASDRNDGRFRQ